MNCFYRNITEAIVDKKQGHENALTFPIPRDVRERKAEWLSIDMFYH